MKIAVDAMGGDFAPEQVVFGAIRAAKKYDCEIVLVGDEAKIREVLELRGHDYRLRDMPLGSGLVAVAAQPLALAAALLGSQDLGLPQIV